MMKKITFSLLFVLATLMVQAQDYTFKVMASNGSVKLKSNGKRLWGGSMLNGGDQIVVGSGSYLGLIHKNGRTLELKSPGTYAVSDLASKVGDKGSSTTSKYVNYVVGEMSKADKQDINKNHRKYMAVTGSVSRALGTDVGVYLPGIVKDVPYSPSTYSNKLYMRFYPVGSDKKLDKVYIKITDMYEEEVARHIAEDGLFILDLSKLPYKMDRAWKITISLVENPGSMQITEGNIAMLGEGEQYDRVTKALEEIGDEDTALNKIIKAGMFEQEKLLADAVRCYEEAIKLAPEVDTYKVAYQDFLVRNTILPLQMNPDVELEDLTKEKQEEK